MTDEAASLDLLRSLWRLDHGLQALSKRMASRRGVTGPQELVLRAIRRRPEISASELAQELSLHPSTLTGVIHRLEARGRLVRTVDPDDRRRALFHLTDAGSALAEGPQGTVEEILANALAAVDADALTETLEVLRRFADALDLALAEPATRSLGTPTPEP